MYPYRCEACGARFYRKVKVGEIVAPPRRPEVHPPPVKRPASGDASKRSDSAPARSPVPGGTHAKQDPPRRMLSNLDTPSDALTHDDFVDLIDHIKQAEERQGLAVRREDDKDS